MPYVVPAQPSSGVASSVPLSGITAGVAFNSFGSGESPQSWQWTYQTTPGIVGLELGESLASIQASTILQASTLAASLANPFKVVNRGVIALSFDPASGNLVIGGGATANAIRFLEP
ncbi:MAG: hypothetical protein ACREB3_10085, partial [Burkholderiales bacterium]